MRLISDFGITIYDFIYFVLFSKIENNSGLSTKTNLEY
jgi:hypothetical protein